MLHYAALLLYMTPFAVVWICMDIMGMTRRSRIRYRRKSMRRPGQPYSTSVKSGTRTTSSARSPASRRDNASTRHLPAFVQPRTHSPTTAEPLQTLKKQLDQIRSQTTSIRREHQAIYDEKARNITERVRQDEEARIREEQERNMRDQIEESERNRREAEERMLRERSNRDSLMDPPSWF